MDEKEKKDASVQEEKKPEGSEKNVGMAIVAYFLFFVPLLTDSKNDPFVKFHVKQGLLLFVAWVAFWVLRSLPFIGRTLWMIYPLVALAMLVLLIRGIINAANGEMKPLPVIGKFATQWFKF